jgi:hypothetical protein
MHTSFVVAKKALNSFSKNTGIYILRVRSFGRVFCEELNFE